MLQRNKLRQQAVTTKGKLTLSFASEARNLEFPKGDGQFFS
ncbi:hypothetical protein [Erwinia tracheiphila]|nr:hypothetical protein [Erwinia tracheiphila]